MKNNGEENNSNTSKTKVAEAVDYGMNIYKATSSADTFKNIAKSDDCLIM